MFGAVAALRGENKSRGKKYNIYMYIIGPSRGSCLEEEKNPKSRGKKIQREKIGPSRGSCSEDGKCVCFTELV